MNIPKIPVKHTKLIVFILILLLILCSLAYSYIFYIVFSRNEFVDNSLETANINNSSIFKVNKILLYSSGNAIDKTKDRSLQNMDVCQYTDIAIYIDNTSYISELTTQNTVKDLWIDNIQVSTSNKNVGTPVFNYKNLNTFGTFENINTALQRRIDFNVINTNEENENADYNSPTFYTDCSNPISLGYLNRGVVQNYSIHDDVNSISLNGKLLEQAGTNLADLNYNVTFDVYIKNYDNDTFVYHSNLEVILDTDNKEIFGGYLYQTRNTSGGEYSFYKM